MSDKIFKGLKTPISYYGGKQMMASKIIKLFPTHKLYAEPFVGGAAVLFKKEPSKIEVINDLNGDVVNFYRVLKCEFELLKYLVTQTPHSRAVYIEAGKVLEHPDIFSDIKRAWAFWVRCNMSFGSSMNAGFGFGKSGDNTEKRTMNKRLNFNEGLSTRLDKVQIECYDAVKVIKTRDTKESFFYCDPPYFQACMGHYDGYTKQDFIDLLTTLSKIEGKFLLSSYDSDLLQEFTNKFSWDTLKLEMSLSMTSNSTKRKKVEVLTANYKLKK